MIDMHMRKQHGFDPLQIKFNLQVRMTPCVRSLKQPAVDEQRSVVVESQLMTRAGDPFVSAMVDEFHNSPLLCVEGEVIRAFWDDSLKHKFLNLRTFLPISEPLKTGQEYTDLRSKWDQMNRMTRVTCLH